MSTPRETKETFESRVDKLVNYFFQETTLFWLLKRNPEDQRHRYVNMEKNYIQYFMVPAVIFWGGNLEDERIPITEAIKRLLNMYKDYFKSEGFAPAEAQFLRFFEMAKLTDTGVSFVQFAALILSIGHPKFASDQPPASEVIDLLYEKFYKTGLAEKYKFHETALFSRRQSLERALKHPEFPYVFSFHFGGIKLSSDDPAITGLGLSCHVCPDICAGSISLDLVGKNLKGKTSFINDLRKAGEGIGYKDNLDFINNFLDSHVSVLNNHKVTTPLSIERFLADCSYSHTPQVREKQWEFFQKKYPELNIPYNPKLESKASAISYDGSKNETQEHKGDSKGQEKKLVVGAGFSVFESKKVEKSDQEKLLDASDGCKKNQLNAKEGPPGGPSIGS